MIRNLVREFLLQEEVFGAQAFVYHGSQTKPKDLIPIFVNDEFVPGKGSGSMYGKGLYAVYNLKNSNTESGTYGSYIYKLKVNLHGFISFNPRITKLIYKKDLTLSQQASLVGASKDVVKRLKTFDGLTVPEYASDWADIASKYLRNKVKGIIYTGRTDGDCVVIYDPSTIVPVAWKFDDSEWKVVDREMIKPAVRRSAIGNWEEGKYDSSTKAMLSRLNKLPLNQRIINGDFDIYNDSEISSLPEGLTVKGNMNIWDCPLTSIPKGLTVEGSLVITSPSKIASIGTGVKIKNNFYVAWIESLLQIPSDLVVGGILDLSGSKITNLPDNLRICSLVIRESKEIKNLPSGLKLELLSIDSTNIQSIPDDISISRRLNATDCESLTKLPSNLNINGQLLLSGCTNLFSLPPGLKVQDIVLTDTLVKEIPRDAEISGFIYGFKGKTRDPEILKKLKS